MKRHECLNEFTKNLNRIEFMVTLACTGRCKHCSEGTHSSDGPCIRCDAAVEAVCRLAEQQREIRFFPVGMHLYI